VAKTAALSFRVADDLKAGLEQAATADGRSVSSLVERILRAWLVQQTQASQSHEAIPAHPHGHGTLD
jgi:predicted transcriptional regulator